MTLLLILALLGTPSDLIQTVRRGTSIGLYMELNPRVQSLKGTLVSECDGSSIAAYGSNAEGAGYKIWFYIPETATPCKYKVGEIQWQESEDYADLNLFMNGEDWHTGVVNIEILVTK